MYSTAVSRKKKYTKSPNAKDPTKFGAGKIMENVFEDEIIIRLLFK